MCTRVGGAKSARAGVHVCAPGHTEQLSMLVMVCLQAPGTRVSKGTGACTCPCVQPRSPRAPLLCCCVSRGPCPSVSPRRQEGPSQVQVACVDWRSARPAPPRVSDLEERRGSLLVTRAGDTKITGARHGRQGPAAQTEVGRLLLSRTHLSPAARHPGMENVGHASAAEPAAQRQRIWKGLARRQPTASGCSSGAMPSLGG